MARPVWSGAIVFGIVTIPVRMFAAVRDHDVHFHQISRTGHRRVRYLKVAEGTQEPLAPAEIVKGYQVSRGRYVVFEDEELRRLAARKSWAIEITAFVRLEQIDPRYFEQPHYLLPGKEAEKAYRLLCESLVATGRVGLASVVLHGREHLVAIRSLAGALMLQTLRFHDEILDPADLDLKPPRGASNPRELALARQLVESMDEDFAPQKYHDEFHDRLEGAIARKSRGKTIAVAEEKEAPDEGRVINLMEALQRSLGRKPGGSSGGRRPHPRRAG